MASSATNVPASAGGSSELPFGAKAAAKAAAEPVYGRKLKEYQVEELKQLLKKEEARLKTVNALIITKKAEKEGKQVTTDGTGGVKRVFTEEEKQRIRSVFNDVDVDGSGYLDIEELGKVIFKLGVQLGGVELLQAHKELDENGDGRVSFEEFLEWWGSDVSRDRYRGSALVQLKGRLAAREKSVSQSNSAVKLRSAEQYLSKNTTIDVSTTFGEYDASNPTELQLNASAGSSEKFQKKCAEVINLDNLTEWLCLPDQISADLWLSYKINRSQQLALVQQSFKITPGKRAAVERLIEMCRKEHHQLLAAAVAEEGIPEEGQPAHDALAELGVVAEEGQETWGYEATKVFRENCCKLGRHMNVEKSDGVETAEPGSPTLVEDSPDAQLLALLQVMTVIDEAFDFMPALKFDVTDTELTVSVLVFVANTVHDEIRAKMESVVERDLERYLQEVLTTLEFSFGLGGNLSAHLKRVLNEDASLADMLGWGAKLSFKAEYCPKIIEAALSSNTQISDIMLPSFGAGLFRSLRSNFRYRNPLAKLEEAIAYYFADARCTLVGSSGLNESGEGYVWDKAGDAELERIREWAVFFARSVKEKLRLGNKMYRPRIQKLAKKMKAMAAPEALGFDAWGALQDLAESLGELRGVDAFSPYINAKVTTRGGLGPMDWCPSKSLWDSLMKANQKSAEDPKHAAECESRKKLLGDEDYIEQFPALKAAIEHLEETKGSRAMASKEGLLFITTLLRSLKEREFPIPFGEMLFVSLLGGAPEDAGGSDEEASADGKPKRPTIDGVELVADVESSSSSDEEEAQEAQPASLAPPSQQNLAVKKMLRKASSIRLRKGH